MYKKFQQFYNTLFVELAYVSSVCFNKLTYSLTYSHITKEAIYL